MKQILPALTVTFALLAFAATANAQHHGGHVSHHYAPHSYAGHGYFGHGGGHGHSGIGIGVGAIGFNTGHVYGHDYHGSGHGHASYLGGHYSHHSTSLGLFH